MYVQSAKLYDAIYQAQRKDYPLESARITELLMENGIEAGARLLDVACGTGAHLEYLRHHFTCEGLDAEKNMLAVAAARLPDVPLHRADMVSFNLSEKFDAMVCLFSSVGYAPNAPRLNQMLATFAKHLKPGGVAIIEPWFTPEQWVDGTISAVYVDEPTLKIARMNVSRRDGNVAIMNFHFMIASNDGIRTFTEPHRLTLFTQAEYETAFRTARFTVRYDPEGLGRGLFIGKLF